MPNIAGVHTDARLTDLSIQYKNSEYIWDKVMPIRKVSKVSGLYTQYTQDNMYNNFNARVSSGTMPNEIDYGMTTGTYSCLDYALSKWVDQELIDNADQPIQPLFDANDHIMNALSLNAEKRITDILCAAGSYASANKTTLTTTAQWGDSADDPLLDITTGINACFIPANTMIFGNANWNKFRRLPEVVSAIFGSANGGLASEAQVAQLFGLDNVYVSNARYNSAVFGQTASYARIWGAFVWIGYVKPNPGVLDMTFGATFQFQAPKVFTEYDGKFGKSGSTYVKVSFDQDPKIIAADCGYLISNPLITDD